LSHQNGAPVSVISPSNQPGTGVVDCSVRIDAKLHPIVDGLDEILFGAEVAFGGLDGGVAEQLLNGKLNTTGRWHIKVLPRFWCSLKDQKATSPPDFSQIETVLTLFVKACPVVPDILSTALLSLG
jgi:hypothetical protein